MKTSFFKCEEEYGKKMDISNIVPGNEKMAQKL